MHLFSWPPVPTLPRESLQLLSEIKRNSLSNYVINRYYLCGVLHEPGDVEADGEDEDEEGQEQEEVY